MLGLISSCNVADEPVIEVVCDGPVLWTMETDAARSLAHNSVNINAGERKGSANGAMVA